MPYLYSTAVAAHSVPPSLYMKATKHQKLSILLSSKQLAPSQPKPCITQAAVRERAVVLVNGWYGTHQMALLQEFAEAGAPFLHLHAHTTRSRTGDTSWTASELQETETVMKACLKALLTGLGRAGCHSSC